MALKLGLNLGYWGIGPAGEDAVEVVQAAERAGFESVWAAESYGSDVVSVLAWLAPQTTTIKLGAAIMQVPARPPAAAAMAGATIDKLSGGRFLFGFGPSGPQVSEGWYGVPYAKPWGRTREYIEVVREIVAREGKLEHAGEHYQLPLPGGEGKPLKLNFHPERTRIPVFVGAIGRKSVEMAAEICDGWIPIFFSVDAFARTWGEHLEAGFAKGGRQRSDLEVSPTLQVAIDGDLEAAKNVVKAGLVLYFGGMGSRKPTSTSTSPTASASARSPTRSSAASRTATAAAPSRRCPTRSSRRPRWSAARPRSRSGSSASAAPGSTA
jgi:F420-dependent oxidoreductase-like protein